MKKTKKKSNEGCACCYESDDSCEPCKCEESGIKESK